MKVKFLPDDTAGLRVALNRGIEFPSHAERVEMFRTERDELLAQTVRGDAMPVHKPRESVTEFLVRMARAIGVFRCEICGEYAPREIDHVTHTPWTLVVHYAEVEA